LVTLHATDMPYFDSRINVAGWVLLAGLRAWRPREDQTGTSSPQSALLPRP
jgi:hypothetical protein